MRQSKESFAQILDSKMKMKSTTSSTFSRGQVITDNEGFCFQAVRETLAQELNTIQVSLGRETKFQFQSKQKHTYSNSKSKAKISDEVKAPPQQKPKTQAAPSKKEVFTLKAALLDTHSYDAYQYLTALSPLETAFSHVELKKCYRKIALTYHPDRNPQGRNTFVKAREQYQLLSKLFEVAVAKSSHDQ